MTPKYKQFAVTILLALVVLGCGAFSSDCDRPTNTTAKDEQALTEKNQQRLLASQPPPSLTWSLERQQLINRVKLQNDRAIYFYLYLFIEGSSRPVGYYLVDKVSSVDSQLTNPAQLVRGVGDSSHSMDFVLPSPSEDGSYGTNGNGVFGFTPDGVYLETNLKYVVSTIPLGFPDVIQLGVIHTDGDRKLVEAGKKVMDAK